MICFQIRVSVLSLCLSNSFMYKNHLSSDNVLTTGSASKQENVLNNLNYCNHKFAAKHMQTFLSFLYSKCPYVVFPLG